MKYNAEGLDPNPDELDTVCNVNKLGLGFEIVYENPSYANTPIVLFEKGNTVVITYSWEVKL